MIANLTKLYKNGIRQPYKDCKSEQVVINYETPGTNVFARIFNETSYQNPYIDYSLDFPVLYLIQGNTINLKGVEDAYQQEWIIEPKGK